jgi:hypothetical protein
MKDKWLYAGAGAVAGLIAGYVGSKIGSGNTSVQSEGLRYPYLPGFNVPPYVQGWDWTYIGCKRPSVSSWITENGLYKICSFTTNPVHVTNGDSYGQGCSTIMFPHATTSEFVIVDPSMFPGNSSVMTSGGSYSFIMPSKYGSYNMANIFLYAVCKSHGLNPPTPESYGPANTAGYLAALKARWNMINGWPKI